MTPPAPAAFRWRGRDLLLIALASLAGHLYMGIEFGLEAHATQLVRVFRLNDPALYPGDLFVDSLGQYCSFFWVGVAWLARWIDVRWVLVAGHLLSRVALLAAIYELTGRMFPSRRVRYIALAAATVGLRAILAGEVLISPLPTHTTFAFPWLVWGLVFAWRGRPIVAALLLGTACNLNVMTGLPATFVAFAAYAATPRSLNARAVVAAGVWLVVAAPVLWWAGQTPAPDVDPDAYFHTIREIFRWHLDPLRWGWRTYQRLGGLILVLAVAIARTRRTPLTRPMAASMIAILATWLAALITSRVPVLEPLMRLQLGRTATLAVIISVPLAAGAVAQCWTERRRSDFLIIAVMVCAWGVAHGRTLALLLFGIGVLADLRSGRSWVAAVAGRRQRAIQALMTCVVGFLIVQGVVRACLAGSRSGVILRSAQPAWLDVQRWAREHTPADAVFVAPVHETGFRVFSRRPMWLAFDYDAMLWRPDLTGEIQRRHRRLEVTGLTASPVAALDWDALRDLGSAEGIDFAVVPVDLLDRRRAEYRNGKWAVVSLDPTRNVIETPSARP